jgi:hypothetical protein
LMKLITLSLVLRLQIPLPTINKIYPRCLFKNLASVMGWDLISSVIENDLLSNYVKTAESDLW